MKHRSTHSLLATLGACILPLLSSPLLANETSDPPDTSQWVCKLCPISGGWMNEWDLGLIYVDDPTPRFADYRGLIDDGFYLEASGDTRYRDDNGYYFDFIGRNLGIRSRQLDMRGGLQGTWEARAHYQEIPRYLGYGTTTPYQGVGTDTLTLAEGWKSQPFQSVSLKSRRKTYGGGFTLQFAGNWNWQADYERQDKSGTKAFGGGVFAINAAWFPAPLDYKTDLFTTALEFNGKRGQARLEYINSDFNNDNLSVTWDNPFATGFGDEVSRSALEPDNKFQQLSLAGAYRFTRRFRFSGKAYLGKIKQDVPFLPYSINPEYEDRELPRDSLDGKLETSMYNLSGRFYLVLADRLDLTAAYKADKRDNKTPVDSYMPVIMEVWSAGPRSNRPYEYDRDQWKVDLRWRPTYTMRLMGGYKNETLKRTYQDVRKSDEDTWWGEFQFTPWHWFDARLKYEYLDRDNSVYEPQGNYDRAENPLMRKFNMADRQRDRGTAEVDLFLVDNLGINVSYYITDDDYDNSIIGLTSAKETSINLDINYAISKAAVVYGFYTRDKIKSTLSGSSSPANTMIWDGYTDDKINTWGLGLNGEIGKKWTYGVDYVSSKSDGDILVDDGGGQAPFPVLTTKLTNLRGHVKYKMNDRWGLGLDAYREEYDTADWFIDGYGPLDISGLLTLGDESPDYDVWVVRLMATLTF
ncbi:MAG: MtrB/PioB family decaheme-associated outer membrane protein [Xanthomonadales bacterium]|jgi:MtrB/PioB family decaheme-associated outer membrane protein|nr:MtrB/PioB family decaheme-associated outer membrane protein [Xanthomonadales bacterium]MDH3923160.1 MtrB/PioB family decaheme-associated outer membrane protein [Xanthomonadales bacterium]MDH3939794.1 MtrB/PioB family decaheme-associated outer membrane protein [Xanthomonadales bacterium]MDH4000285.1 MtrB/PioB family decaheme-associated outer membrane protein [Xanthomonadales bacterium]